jgi:hypothetical protein
LMRSRSRPKNPSSSLRQTNPTPHDLHRPAIAVRQIKQKLLQFRRVATRYDKLLANFMSFVNSPL